MVSGLFGGVIWIPLFIALWVGVVALSRGGGRGGAWWTMLSGLVLLSLGVLIGILGAILMTREVTAMMAAGAGPAGAPVAVSPPTMEPQIVLVGGAASMGLGCLLFGIGFAVHGFAVRRLRDRIGELEMVIEAQNEQMSRLEGSPAREV